MQQKEKVNSANVIGRREGVTADVGRVGLNESHVDEVEAR
jgi:hypothetical protein